MKALALLYHDVVAAGAWDASGFPGAVPAAYKLERRDFERHLAAVSALGARQGTVRDLFPPTPGAPPVLLTFDDGGASACGVADLLEHAGWRGHFLITTDYLGTPGFVTRGQVRDLAARGHVIGTHSCSHPTPMSRCSWERLLEEWSRSAGVLAEVLGEPVRVGSVPGGALSGRVVAAAAAAGLRALFTSEPTPRCRLVDGCVVIGRFVLRRGTPPAVAAALASGQRLARLRQLWSWNLKKVAKAVAGDLYPMLSEAVHHTRARWRGAARATRRPGDRV
ncbi:MAG TPA: polysaccharide deacetylase family protein [Gemmatimonadales bacterium]|nr:polysaccharide deacetylase family protein [Gemmatimonadales bacterium]